VYRLYAIPMIGTGSSRLDPRRPKYVVEAGIAWSLMDYGTLPTGLVAADVTQAQHDALAANADVDAFAANLDTAIGAASTTVRSRLEANRIPTQWVSGATTYRELARFVAGLFQFAQRHAGLHNEDIIGSGALDGRFRDLDAAQQGRIQATATSFGYTLTTSANTPMRDVLTQMATQWGAQPFYLGGLTF
jgi:uncharacterized protein YejL (UPF0352 family)